jgi:hypothetical protein
VHNCLSARTRPIRQSGQSYNSRPRRGSSHWLFSPGSRHQRRRNTVHMTESCWPCTNQCDTSGTRWWKVEGSPYTPTTDCGRSHFGSRPKCSPKQFRYLDYIAQFTTDVRHVPDEENPIADALSRVEAVTVM